MGRTGRERRREARLQGHRSAGGGDRSDPGAVRSVRAVRVQAHGERGNDKRGTENGADGQNGAGQQQTVLQRAGNDGQVPGAGEVLHGGEHQEGGADGHDRGGRWRRGAHVQHGGRRVLHRA